MAFRRREDTTRDVEMAWISPFRRYAPTLLVLCVAILIAMALAAGPGGFEALHQSLVSELILILVYAALAALAAYLFVEARQREAITERERADAEELFGLSERLATTLESIGEGVVAPDLDGVITFMNGVAAQLTGWPISRALNAPVREVVRIVHEKERNPIEDPLRQALTRGSRVREDTTAILTARNGKEYPIAFHAAPILDSDGWIIGAVLVFQDVTGLRAVQRHREQLIEELSRANERLKEEVARREEGRRAALNLMQDAQLAQAALRKSEENLRETNAALEEYARVASHDLQEPLRKIESFAQVLIEDYGGKLDTQGRDYLDIMVRSAGRMRRLIRDVLAFSRAGNAERPFGAVDLTKVMALVQDNLSERVRERDAHLIMQELPTVHGDETQMIQLLQNLVGNALKFNNKPNPRVEVSVEDLGHEWKISVRDNGIGMYTADADTIFAPFKRLHSQQEYEGTGIGLAICRRIVTRHGGRIGAESELNKGSTFWFTLPKTEVGGGGPSLASASPAAMKQGEAQ
jgi:PAS domain S-box-containing protein